MPLHPFTPLQADPLPAGADPLTTIYGSPLFTEGRPALYSNFVESIDGVVVLPDGASSGTVISGRSEADRFLMGFLRAQADAVIIGAGTLKGSPGHRWTAGDVSPAHAEQFAALRSRLGLDPEPTLVVITGSGDIAKPHDGLQGRTVIVTTNAGKERIGSDIPGNWKVHALGNGERVDLTVALNYLRDLGFESILTEAGPTLNAQLIDLGLLDELFVTVSPVIAGAISQHRGLATGMTFLPDRRIEARLMTCHANGDFLFLRYGLK